ncbi:hypothetical protein NQ176_g11430 [Zarea fungicola]|uniref:Uncharacterized protein n=1 Tax=Zarea fungicola TaxID=93591 RepID=A0ACC1MAT5_9HYPO|nr:hypothetical protein NQ176_g11430 [Lecanicillium fungicola]
MLAMLKVSALFADESGNMPAPLTHVMTLYSNIVWLSYDYVVKPIFGDGERTQRKDGGKPEAAKVKDETAPLLNGRP